MATKSYKVTYHQIVKLVLRECTAEIEAASEKEAMENFDINIPEVKNIIKGNSFEKVDNIKDTILNIISAKPL